MLADCVWGPQTLQRSPYKTHSAAAAMLDFEGNVMQDVPWPPTLPPQVHTHTHAMVVVPHAGPELVPKEVAVVVPLAHADVDMDQAGADQTPDVDSAPALARTAASPTHAHMVVASGAALQFQGIMIAPEVASLSPSFSTSRGPSAMQSVVARDASLHDATRSNEHGAPAPAASLPSHSSSRMRRDERTLADIVTLTTLLHAFPQVECARILIFAARCVVCARSVTVYAGSEIHVSDVPQG
jgi:hypothetical protein